MPKTVLAAKGAVAHPATPVKGRKVDESARVNIVTPAKKTPIASRGGPVAEEDILSSATKLFDVEEPEPEAQDAAKKISIPTNATAVYRVLNKTTGTLGGNGYNGAIYGELTIGSMQKILNVFKEKCNLTKRSRFVDVGAGLGKPNFHAAQDPQVRVSLGIELEEIRYQLSMQNLNSVLKTVQAEAKKEAKKETKKEIKKETKKPAVVVAEVTPVPEKASQKSSKGRKAVAIPDDLEQENDSASVNTNTTDAETQVAAPIHHAVNFICNDIDEAKSLDPFTHIYMYDLGFPPDLQASIARKFNSSVHARYLVSYRPPRRVIDEYKYNVRHIHSMLTSMFGSGEGHTAYFYERIMDMDEKDLAANADRTLGGKAAITLTLPARCPGILPAAGDEGENEDEEVYCDPLFRKAVALAVGPLGELAVHAEEVATEFMNRGRAKRERKPRVLHNV